MSPTSTPNVGRQAFPELSTKELKKLRNDSSSIRALSVLWILGAVILLVAAGVADADEVGIPPVVFAILGVLQLATAIACWTWSTAGRWMGLLVCLLMVPGVPIGTLIGLLGLVAFARSGSLFGSQRISVLDVKAEFWRRRREGVA